MSKEIKLSETEQKLYGLIKENGNMMNLWDIRNHEDTRLVGAIGKLKSNGLIKIIRKYPKEEPRKEFRKVLILTEAMVEGEKDVEKKESKSEA